MNLTPFNRKINWLYHQSKLSLVNVQPEIADFYELKELLFLFWLTDAGLHSFSESPRDRHVFTLLRIEGLVTEDSLTSRGVELAAALLRTYVKLRDVR